ncbi:hypothetical protein BMS3Bbin04_02056 [bacterium BMS3Bbin04]|nr:hypothetical protein BMS3Bbin04_02056 [bacterium BMS3Bbin04]
MFDHLLRHTPRPRFLTKFLQHPDQIRFVVFVDHFRRSSLLTSIHPHVQGARLHKAETTCRIINLMTGNAQIEQDSVEWLHRLDSLIIPYIAEVQFVNADPFVIRKTSAKHGQSIIITVNCEQLTTFAQLIKDCGAMTATTRSCIEISPVRLDTQPCQRLRQHNRNMVALSLYHFRLRSVDGWDRTSTSSSSLSSPHSDIPTAQRNRLPDRF